MRWILAGWLLFIVSALFFAASALRSGDMLALGGSLFFLIACFAFLVPFMRDYRNRS
ncbi:MAG: cytochrome oxidase subunit III [Rhizobiaceae bacterium]